MSRSRKHTPIGGFTTVASEKRDKQAAHRAFRRAINRELRTGRTDALPVVRETSNVWAFGKDGRHFFGRLKLNAPETYRRAMRK